MVKKIYNYLFIFCLTIAICLGFKVSNSKAAITPPSVTNNVDYSREDYNSNISEYSLFNSFDYSYLDQINVDIHLTSSNLITTDIEPTATQVTTYSGNCFGNLCYNKTVYLIDIYLYYTYTGGTYRIYQNSNNEPSGRTLSYSSSQCNTVTYYNNSLATYSKNFKIVFEDFNYYNQALVTFNDNYENEFDMLLSASSTLNDSIFGVFNNYKGKILTNYYTGLTNSSTSKTSTCNSSQSTQYTCNSSLNENYIFHFYTTQLGTINLNSGLIYQNGKCLVSSIGSNVDNGYYKSYEIDYNNYDLSLKQNIWNKLTQINSTSTFNVNTLTITKYSSNGHVISGLDINFRLELIFKSSINYEYNNAYFKFNTNSTATLNNFYYGIFDLNLNYSFNDTYTVALLNESSTINSNNLILISNIDMIAGPITFDYNFNISYITDVLIDQIGFNSNLNDCRWYQFMCHVENFFTKTIYSIPILSDFYSIFNSLIGTISTVIDLVIEYKELQFIGTVLILSLCYHFIKRSVE